MLSPGHVDVDAEHARRLEHPDLGCLTTGLPRLLGGELCSAARGDRASEQAEHGIGCKGLRHVRVVLEVELAERRPDPDRTHPVLGQRPGLVRADHVRRAEGFDCAQTLDERPAAREPGDSDCQRQRDRRQQPFRDVRDDQPDREGEGVVRRQPGDEHSDREKREPDEHCDEGDEPRDLPHLTFEWALLHLHPLRERCDPAELRLHPGGKDEGLRLARDARGSAEHEISCVEQRATRIALVGRAKHGLRLPGERRHVDVDRALEETRVRRDPVALDDEQDVAGHELARVDGRAVRIADDRCLDREVEPQRLDGAFGLTFLHEREQRVQDDDQDDCDAEDGRDSDEREHRSRPEQQRERMCELLQELTRPTATAMALELVRPVRRKAPLGLPTRQPFGAGAKIAEEELDALARLRPLLDPAHGPMLTRTFSRSHPRERGRASAELRSRERRPDEARYRGARAPVAQWIEQRFPKPRAHVRFMPGALSKPLSITFLLSSALRSWRMGFPQLPCRICP